VAEPRADDAGLHVRLRQDAPIPLDVEFSCAPGQLTALFGPSGSGKTTILRAIAGLYTPRETLVRCAGRTWCDTAGGVNVPTHARSVGFVFQDYALFPHMTVREQLMAAMGDQPRESRAPRADELIATVHLTGLGDRRPAALSGGQQQRVAIARALARDPDVLLLDEPFASVDRSLRDALHHELAALKASLRIPIVLVTHDFDDVTRLASDLVMLDGGRISAAGTVPALTADNALPGVSRWREPAVVLDAEVIARDDARELSLVRAGTLTLQLPALAVADGARVRLEIPAREIILASERPVGLSLHNVVEAQVQAVQPVPEAPGQRLVALLAGDVRLLALVTADAVRRLALEPGRPVLALIKAVSVDVFA
jgi:molybdate transport system ATP-binding protein